MPEALISPTHKRTEGRAPVWGFELTSKDAALQGGARKIAAMLNEKLCDLPARWWCLASYPLFSPNPLTTRKLKADAEIKSRLIGVE
jgi:hypothetical protein